MTRLELLASQLDCEAFPHEVKATENIFSRNIRFWELCLACDKVLQGRKPDTKNTENSTIADKKPIPVSILY